jgi:hypothetical protein
VPGRGATGRAERGPGRRVQSTHDLPPASQTHSLQRQTRTHCCPANENRVCWRCAQDAHSAEASRDIDLSGGSETMNDGMQDERYVGIGVGSLCHR